ncbi:hypothetical protein [Rickettsia endosymbiont of Gonocerus acuteangulatus]|uniref:hypothetical protein n=1 Tax=Rickettsia endosymbiont of Gonocerus acuteangulatus TaxID=3066266 RepID=UPI0031333537
MRNCFKLNKTLIGLDLGNNDIDKTGANEIEKALKANTTLIFLNLTWNSVESAKYLVRNANLTNEQELVKMAKKFNEIDEEKLLKKLDIIVRGNIPRKTCLRGSFSPVIP